VLGVEKRQLVMNIGEVGLRSGDPSQFLGREFVHASQLVGDGEIVAGGRIVRAGAERLACVLNHRGDGGWQGRCAAVWTEVLALFDLAAAAGAGRHGRIP
jgi:hypothetical protein